MKKYLINFILFMGFNYSHAQIITSPIDTSSLKKMVMPKSSISLTRPGNTVPQVAPPSPHIAELDLFGAVPVGLYTGTIQYSIPIFTLENEHLSLPIS